MSGQWASSNRRDTLPADWAKIRSAVKRRARGQCEWVGDPIKDGPAIVKDGPEGPQDGHRCTNKGTDCDHRVDRDDHRVEACQWLCPDHHKHKTQLEAREAAEAQRAKLAHPSTRAKHPGLI